MKVTAILKGRPDSLGRQSVYIRIADKEHRRFKAIPVRVLPRQFKKGKVIDHPDREFLNMKIKGEIMKVEKKGCFIDDSAELLKGFIEQSLKDYAHSRSPETIRHYRSKSNAFLSFAGNIPLSSITSQTLNKYREHLINQGISGNNLWSYMKFTRTFLNKAIREGLITSNPLLGFEMPKYKDPPKRFLLRSEVDKIEKAIPRLQPELKLSATWFLIGCFTGFRYGDMNKFTKKQIKGNRITVYTSKTGEVVSLPFLPQIKQLFESIEYEPLHLTNQTYNRHLKAIGAIADIGELNGHLSRHTAATLLAEAGVSQEVTAKILGHSNLKTTAIYYKITANRIDDELGKLFK
jgi:integrase